MQSPCSRSPRKANRGQQPIPHRPFVRPSLVSIAVAICLVAGCEQRPAPASPLDRALNGFWMGNFSQARTHLDEFLAENPQRCVALELQTQLPENNLSARLAHHERYWSLCDDRHDVEYVGLLILAGNWEKACDLASPPATGAMAALAVEACVDTSPEARLESTTEFLQQYPNTAGLLSLRAYALSDLGRTPEAIESAVSAMRHGDFSESHLYRVRGLLQRTPYDHWLTADAVGVLLNPPSSAKQTRKVEAFHAVLSRLSADGFKIPWHWRIQTANRSTAMLDATHCQLSEECATWLDLLDPVDWPAIVSRGLSFRRANPEYILRKIYQQPWEAVGSVGEDLANAGLDRYSRAAVLHFARGLSREAKEPDDAVMLYLHAIDLAPWETAWRNRAADLLERRGRTNKARQVRRGQE